MTADSDGNLWIAMFSGDGVNWDLYYINEKNIKKFELRAHFQLIKVDPNTGKQIGCVKVPTKRATCPTFGGKNLDILYITTAGAFMPNENASDIGEDCGAVFQAENVGARGISGGISFAGV